MATKSAKPSSASSAASKPANTGRSGTGSDKSANQHKTPRTLAGHTQPADDAVRRSALGRYESAIKLLHAGKFDKAHEAFTQLLAGAPPDIAPSVRMYISTCQTEIERGTAKFNNNEDRYDYAVSLLNTGHYEDAREHFEAILAKDRNADYAFYGLALVAAVTFDAPRCIENLTQAVRLNPQTRLQARLDSDFDPVADDPAFTELLYPEA